MHLIEQNILDVYCSSPNFGKTLHDRLSWVMERRVYPKLEDLLNQYTIPNYTWSIDQLHIHLLDLNKDNWEEEFVNMTLLQIEEFLKNNKPQVDFSSSEEYQSNFRLLSKQQQAIELFFYYLKTGTLPENTLANNSIEITNSIEVNTDFIRLLQSFFEENPQTIVRFVLTMLPTFRATIIQKMGVHIAYLESLMQEVLTVNFFKKSTNVLKQFVSDSIVKQQWIDFLILTNQLYTISNQKRVWIESFKKHSSYWNINVDEHKIIFSIFNQQVTLQSTPLSSEQVLFLKELNEKRKDSPQQNQVEDETLTYKKEIITPDFQFITNAGLVLLHPFLETLFGHLNLTKNNQWKDKKCQDKGVLLTQYLVTGSTTFFENELWLNKLLCGLNAIDEVNTQLKITKKEKEKCQDLLTAVLEHWTAMNNSSIEALRETFLLRNGKVSFPDSNAIELQVEAKGVDILLGKLPWGISYVKTPWMEEYLICDWS
jgi:hypothetical protein